MTRGGARNRSGPPPVEGSRTSDRKGLILTALPPAGFDGEAPAWPLGTTLTDDLTGARELQIWAEVWTTPQACAWFVESWRWPILAEYCRLKAIIELTPSASAALIGQIHRYRDQLGLTPAGLKENGWKIAESKPEPSGQDPKSDQGNVTSIKDRLSRGSA